MNALFQLTTEYSNEHSCPQNLYENVHSRIIHNSTNVETASTDMNIDYNTLIVVSLFNGILLNHEKNKY